MTTMVGRVLSLVIAAVCATLQNGRTAGGELGGRSAVFGSGTARLITTFSLLSFPSPLCSLDIIQGFQSRGLQLSFALYFN